MMRMDAAFSPVQQFIQDNAPLLADHIALLRRTSIAVTAARDDFLSQWKALLMQEHAHPEVVRWCSAEVLNRAVTIVADGMTAWNGSLPEYLQGLAAWSAELYANGLDYTDQFVLWTTYRRARLPFLLRECAAGPELRLVFHALDAQERAVMGLCAVVGTQIAQEQLAQGIHQRAVARVSGGVAHVLSNTMVAIIGRAQIVEEQITNPELRDELRAIQRAARAGADALKRLQQLVAEREEREMMPLDVNSIVTEAIQLARLCRRDDQANGAAFEVNKELEPVPPVMGQAAGLRDVLVELILNRVEAMPEGGTITVRTVRAADRVLIAVTAKGAGHVGVEWISAANIVRQMRGTMTLDSAPGRGTMVRIALPIVSEAPPSASAHS
jgi:signal transduction histidine kinase